MQRATTWVSGTGSQWVQVVAAIENTGSANLYLSSGAYDLEDASGALVGCGSMVSEYPSVLAPGETGYLHETTLQDEPIDIDFSMDKYDDLRIKGRGQSTSDETYIQTKIVAVLFDADGNLLGLDYTYLDEDLAPGQKVGFELSVMELPESLLEQVADCRVWAYPVQYNW